MRASAKAQVAPGRASAAVEWYFGLYIEELVLSSVYVNSNVHLSPHTRLYSFNSWRSSIPLSFMFREDLPRL